MPKPDEDFKFGLMERGVRDYQSLSGLYLLPLKKMWHQIRRRLGLRPARRAETEIEGAQQ